MTPVLIHADGTDCTHQGRAQATMNDPDGPVCAGGQQITHVRFGGKTLTVEEAYVSLQSIADVWTKALTPIVTALAWWGRQVSADPCVRALAAAAAVVDEEREREATRDA